MSVVTAPDSGGKKGSDIPSVAFGPTSEFYKVKPLRYIFFLTVILVHQMCVLKYHKRASTLFNYSHIFTMLDFGVGRLYCKC